LSAAFRYGSHPALGLSRARSSAPRQSVAWWRKLFSADSWFPPSLLWSRKCRARRRQHPARIRYLHRLKETDMRTSFYIGITAAALTLAGCTVGPNYKRPQVAVPQSFHAPEPLPESQGASLADLKWFEVFRDPQLDDLIKVALVQNYDLRDAVARVDQSRANLGITRSNQYPQVSASGDLQFTRLSRDGQFPLPASFVTNQNRNWGEAALNLLSFQ